MSLQEAMHDTSCSDITADNSIEHPVPVHGMSGVSSDHVVQSTTMTWNPDLIQ